VKQAEFSAVNGCMSPRPHFPRRRPTAHLHDLQGCSAGHPTVYCVFDGAHVWEPRTPVSRWAGRRRKPGSSSRSS